MTDWLWPTRLSFFELFSAGFKMISFSFSVPDTPPTYRSFLEVASRGHGSLAEQGSGWSSLSHRPGSGSWACGGTKLASGRNSSVEWPWLSHSFAVHASAFGPWLDFPGLMQLFSGPLVVSLKMIGLKRFAIEHAHRWTWHLLWAALASWIVVFRWYTVFINTWWKWYLLSDFTPSYLCNSLR